MQARVEPGHHFEWAWLLAELGRVRGRHIRGAQTLSGFALRHGLDPASGLLRGELFDDGSVAMASVRLWPHCEWLKATLALNGEAGDPRHACAAMARFLKSPIEGLWFERWDAEAGIFLNSPVPASSLYHVTAALTALGRHVA
jgi:mannose-6-phosphate isomerase